MTGLENKVLYVDMDGVLARWEDASYRDVSSEGFFLSRKECLEKCMLLQKKYQEESRNKWRYHVGTSIFYRIFSALDTGICITGTLSSAEKFC